MNKPDWKDAPEWAQFLALDVEGDWFWFELEPRSQMSIWATHGRCEFAGSTPRWQDTLESRP